MLSFCKFHDSTLIKLLVFKKNFFKLLWNKKNVKLHTIITCSFSVFGSIDRSRSNSMTSSGQCRLSPLIPCIQDASKLYDFCVKILFKLHSELSPDILAGHRERFLKQFRELKSFYQNTNMMQYFRYLITIPSLPEVRQFVLNTHTYTHIYNIYTHTHTSCNCYIT